MGSFRPVIVSRVLTLLIIVGLALPSAMATRQVAAATDASIQAVQEAPVNAAADQASAKAKKKDKKDKKGKKDKKDTSPPPVQQFTTVTRIVRQPVTKTFSTTGLIAVPTSGSTFGVANPYPSVLNVDGFVNGVITDVNLTLIGFGHDQPDDVDILLAGTGQNAKVMSDAGGIPEVFGLTLTLDDQAATSLPDNPAITSPMVSGTFKPSDYFPLDDTFPAPAPAPSGNVPLSVFNTRNPNGTWQLFVNDANQFDTGSIAGGWSLQITAEADVEVQEQVAVPATPDPPKEKKDKKKKKGSKKGRN